MTTIIYCYNIIFLVPTLYSRMVESENIVLVLWYIEVFSIQPFARLVSILVSRLTRFDSNRGERTHRIYAVSTTYIPT